MGRYRCPTNGPRLEVHRVENSEGVDLGRRVNVSFKLKKKRKNGRKK